MTRSPRTSSGPRPAEGVADRSDGAGDRRALRAAQCRDAGRDQPDRHPLDRGRQLARAEPLRDRPGDRPSAPVPLERLLQRRAPWPSSSTNTTASTLPPELSGKCVNSTTNTCLGAAATQRQYVDSESEHHVRPPDGQRPEAALRPSEQPGRGCRPVPGTLEALLARHRPYFNTPLVQLNAARRSARRCSGSEAWKAARRRDLAYVQDGKVHVADATGARLRRPAHRHERWQPLRRPGVRLDDGSGEPGAVLGPSDPANTAAAVMTGSVAPVGGTLTARPGHLESVRRPSRCCLPMAALQHPGRRLREHPRREPPPTRRRLRQGQAPAGGRLGRELDLVL